MLKIRRAISTMLRNINATTAQTKRLERQANTLHADLAQLAALQKAQTKIFSDLLKETRSQSKLLAAQNKTLSAQAQRIVAQNEMLDTLRLAATSALCDDVQAWAATRQMALLETVTYVADHETSFARFGDGEFREMMRDDYRLGFQPNSPELMASLRRVLAEPVDGLLVGFPHVYRDAHWSGVWADIWAQLRPLVEPIEHFGNSHVSRPLFFQQLGQEGVQAWRRVWEDRDVCIITGRGSRFEMLPALFSGVRSVRRVDSTPLDAFTDLPRLLADGELGQADLFLISLGPAGTILAHRLAQRGQRAVDIGHLSDSYLNVFEGGAWPEFKRRVV